MPDFDFSISKILSVRTDSIEKERPYISVKPRISSAIVYVLSGTLLYSADSEVCRAPEDSVLYIEGGKSDISKPEGEKTEYVFFDFDCDEPPAPADDGLRRVNYPKRPGEIKERFMLADRLWHERDFCYKPRCRELLYGIINTLSADNYAGTGSQCRYAKIRPAILKMESEYMTDLAVSELAELCKMSVGGFSRLFTEVTGKAPRAYLADVRIGNADNYIRSGAYSITEIAQKVGFANIYSFSRAYKRCFGFPPSHRNG